MWFKLYIPNKRIYKNKTSCFRKEKKSLARLATISTRPHVMTKVGALEGQRCPGSRAL